MRFLSLLLSFLPALAAGGSSTLTVSAAASLNIPLESVARTFEEQHPGSRIVFNFGSSGSLQHQIENGAPIDVFISAATRPMLALEEKGFLLPGSSRIIVRNTIVLIAPAGSTVPQSFEGLTDAGIVHIAIGEPASVPAGMYAMEILEHLGLTGRLRPKLVFAKDVRQVLVYVESKNAGAGIVYSSDAKGSRAVRIVAPAPPGSHQPVEYPAAVIARSAHPDAARAFLKFLESPEALDIFRAAGFEIPHP